MSSVQRSLAKHPQRPKAVSTPTPQTPPAPPGGIARASHEDLIARAFALAPAGEGCLIWIVAPPRKGKTVLCRKLVKARATTDIVLIHDPKLPPNYPEILHLPTATLDNIAEQETEVIAFPIEVCPDELVGIGIETARLGIPTTTILDEGAHAIDGKQAWKGKNCARAYREGSSQGHSLVVNTQMPQLSPTEQIDFSQAIILGPNGGRCLTYLEDKLRLPPDLVALIPTLSPGEFLLVTQYAPWDRTVYYSPE